MLHCNSFQFNCNTFYFFRTVTLLKKLLKDHESFFYHSFSVTTFTFGQNNIPTCSEPPHPARRCPEHIPKATAQVIVKCPERRRSRYNLCFDRGADSHPEETVSVVFSSGEAWCPRAEDSTRVFTACAPTLEDRTLVLSNEGEPGGARAKHLDEL